jgi:hypothetical protein
MRLILEKNVKLEKAVMVYARDAYLKIDSRFLVER